MNATVTLAESEYGPFLEPEQLEDSFTWFVKGHVGFVALANAIRREQGLGPYDHSYPPLEKNMFHTYWRKVQTATSRAEGWAWEQRDAIPGSRGAFKVTVYDGDRP